MVSSKANATSADGVTVVTSKKRMPSKRNLVKISIVVIVLATAGTGTWLYLHRAKPLTTQQQGVQKALPAQEQFLQEEKQSKTPDSTQSITYANLAISYSIVNKCDQAHAALNQAKALATPDLQQNTQDAETTVKTHCK
jgi:hypothetical protein